MYLDYYNLSLKPFEISPDPKFLWLGSNHKKVFVSLEQGILENKGLMVLAGDAGTGKTTLVNALSNRLKDDSEFVQIFDPSLQEIDLFSISSNVLKFSKKFKANNKFAARLNTYLNRTYEKDRNVTLIIEEA